MTQDMMTLRALLEKSSDADLLCEMIGFTAERLMALEVEGLTGAAHGDGDEAIAQTVEPELTDHSLVPSLRCGVFRRSVNTQQFVDPSTQLAGPWFVSGHAAIRALRARNRCRISDSITAFATSVFTAEAEGARPTVRKPLFTARVCARSGRRAGGSAMTSPSRLHGRSSSTPRYGRLFSARGRVIARWSSRRRSLP